MLDDLKKELVSVKYLSILLTIAVSIYLLQIVLQVLDHFSDIFLIIVFAWLLSFILEPVVYRISKILRIPVIVSTLLVYLLFGLSIAGIIYIFLPTVSYQLQTLAKILPTYLKSSSPFLQKANTAVLSSFSNYIYIIPSVAQFLVYFITILILSVYLIIDKETISKTFRKITPDSLKDEMDFIQNVINSTIASFIRVQFIFAVIGGLMTAIVMQIFGIHFAASTGLLAGFLSFIPMVGTIIALVPPLLVAFIQDPSKALFITAILIIGQQVVYNVLAPKLFGKAFKIHPIVVLLSLLVGLKVAGLIGGAFAVPLVSIFTIVGKEFYSRGDKK